MKRLALGIALFATLFGAGAGAGVAHAQGAAAAAYPGKPIRFVVPFPPGGPLDIMARAIGQKLTESWGQPVVVDNRPGAGGSLGAELVAKAPGDGYTLLMGAVSTHAINPHLYARIGYDPFRDFVPVALVAEVPNVLVVNPSVPATSVQELVALAKAKPGYLNFGSGSTGSTGHLAGELFKSLAGVDMVHIPYKGGAPAMQDLLGGQVQLMFDNLANSLPQVKAGKLRALAVTTSTRSPAVPDLPTINEAGVKGFDLSTWFGVFVPAGTPPEIVAKLNAGIVAALESKELADRLAAMGTSPPKNNTPAAFAAFVRAENAKYAKVVKESGAKVD
ncbi:MAG: tripartite tricarboxylate transporter substrate binding protein [Burkholderiales bacterium]|jgi:tripartite-type tricarboxylate transporter receptor subunit TctC|nr:tripartite tricarboxylate transporter substrate binding protein [Burkholderiales bacterium]